MMYSAPLKDMRFALEHIVDFSGLMENLNLGDDLSLDLADAILSEAAKLAENVIAPLNHSGDMETAQYDGAGNVKLPEGFGAAYQAMAEGGWTAMDADASHGGQNMPHLLSTLVNEMFYGANMAFSLCHLLTQGQIYALERSATDEQKALFIPPMTEGRWTGTMNLTEAHAGTDLGAIKTKATREGDHYRIKGQKIFITYGEHDMAENIIHLVLARLEGAPAGAKGISVFIVPKFLVNDDGSLGERNDIRCISIEKKLGIKASPTAVLSYGDNEGAIGYLVGEENRGLEIMFGMMNHARFSVGLQGLALSERAMQAAVGYSLERKQGVPLGREAGDTIIHHPDVLRLITGMKAEIEAMRALAVLGAQSLDMASHDMEQNENSDFWQERSALLIPIIKGWLTEASLRITSAALQVHGGMGFIEETGAAQHYRDARILPIYEGTTAIQANDLIFRKVLRDGGAGMEALFTEIEQELKTLAEHEHDGVAVCHQEMQGAMLAARKASAHILGMSNDGRRAAVSGVNYLLMMGYLLGGWLMLRGAGKAANLLASGEGEEHFLSAKLITAEHYCTHILPQVLALSHIILKGGHSGLALDPQKLQ